MDSVSRRSQEVEEVSQQTHKSEQEGLCMVTVGFEILTLEELNAMIL